MAKNRKVRVQFSKNRENKAREGDLTRKYNDGDEATENAAQSERVRAKGNLSRKRTILVDAETGLAVDAVGSRRGRVLMVQGLHCVVVCDDGTSWKCYVRRLLKSFDGDQRSVVAAGDWVRFKPASGGEGLVLSVEPRRRTFVRRYRQREHVIAANIDQILVVGSLVDPPLKPSLVDRYLVTAEAGALSPIVCFNKVDLVDGALVQPFLGLYSQLGYRAVLTSAATKKGIDQLLEMLAGKETAIVGQSGVGKTSLLNALEPTFHLKVAEVSETHLKGRHTTTTAQLLKLTGGGTVIDTPGIRQFGLADLRPDEIGGFFPEFRPFARYCRFPGCSHTHEEACMVKQAVSLRYIRDSRYESFLRMSQGDGDE
ncbi:MAG: ribosome small subunit-dependent GTPase A [Planctomycetia bacterium]